ncbi:MAG TPA: TetR/AcrR family transcriptional regulator [Ramlibacter sp.]|uniref:TetR/AcrR family transcriptional regulator n=1 Tax=Ramlibacter sp. TaxID=1917967 RepID=UPI002B50A9AF|nr:TetR/AcrR family transcriptional regulator [Ramlibacter sp.]HVZ44207.1 TetR/AcrR family transcriptional regulator [Ramlibacter sp.]
MKTSATATRTRAKASRPPEPAPEDQGKSRQRILDAAATVLSREGFAGAKLTDIAAEANLRAATLYYYYESREALVEAVMVTGSEHVRHHTEEMLAGLDPSMDAVDRLCAAVESHLRFVLEISDYTKAVIRNAGQVPQHIRKSLDAEIGRYGKLWQSLVDAAAQGTAFRTRAERRTLRLLILGGLNWTVEWWEAAHTPLDEVVKTATQMTRAMLRKGP